MIADEVDLDYPINIYRKIVNLPNNIPHRIGTCYKNYNHMVNFKLAT